MKATTLRKKYMEYRRALGKLMNGCTGEQFDIYFDILTSSDARLSGKRMATIAMLMAEQKEYGANEIYKELKG